MKFTGENVLDAPVDQAWDALLDPSVLVRTIPGCERLEATGDNAYAMTVTAGVASIKGTYAGSCRSQPGMVRTRTAGSSSASHACSTGAARTFSPVNFTRSPTTRTRSSAA